MKRIFANTFLGFLFTAALFAQTNFPQNQQNLQDQQNLEMQSSQSSQIFQLNQQNQINPQNFQNQQENFQQENKVKIFPAEDVLNRIEDMKAYIQNHPGEKLARKYDMDMLYQILESQTYTASSKDGSLLFEVGDYDTKNQSWPVNLKFKFENSDEVWSTQCNLLYSDVLIKTFISDNQMTQRQRNEYEFNVNYYDNLIRENKILYAELTYKIRHWKAASEYRFEPISLKIYKFERNAQIIYSADYTNLKKTYFYILPSIEIRDDAEKLIDDLRIEQIVSYEEEQQRQLNLQIALQNQQNSSVIEKPVQRKRNSLYFTALSNVSDFTFSDFDISRPVSYVQADFTIGLNRFMFLGAQGAYDLSSVNAAPIYEAGLDFGFNVNLGQHIKPFVYAAGLYTSDRNFKAKLGGGFDFIFGIFMLNLGYSYNFKFDIQSLISSNSTFAQTFTNPEKDMSFYAGFGFTWR